jgi:hypothetical protein
LGEVRWPRRIHDPHRHPWSRYGRGGCGYLQTDDGTRYEILWPDGWELQRGPLELRDPDGNFVATAGDRMTVHGEEATDMGSFCQIGPIFRAVQVDR